MRFPLTLLASLLAAYALSALLTVTVNPETTFWTEAVKQREAAVAKIRAESPSQPIVFFTGGSSCAFSIDPKVIEETCGVPAINLGLTVSSGSRYILHQSLRLARKGDLIVVCLEPHTMISPNKEPNPTKVGFALEARRGNLTDSAGGSTFKRSVTIPDYLTLPRPGAKYLITLAARSYDGKGYQYKMKDINHHGLIRTDIRYPGLAPGGKSYSTALDSGGRNLLETFASAAKRKGVRIAYSMPWYYTKPEFIIHNRANNAEILAEISEIMPVLEDGFSGAMDGAENFADSDIHLSDKGAASRSKALAAALKKHLEL